MMMCVVGKEQICSANFKFLFEGRGEGQKCGKCVERNERKLRPAC